MKQRVNIAITMLMLLSISAMANSTNETMTAKQDVVFEVKFDFIPKGKPFLIVYEKGINSFDAQNAGQNNIYAKSGVSNSFIFELKNQTKPLYFSLYLKDSLMDIPLVREFHFEPGDQIKIDVKGTSIPNIYNIGFSGKGSAKYRCKNDFRDAVQIMDSISGNNKHGNTGRSLKHLSATRQLIDKYQPEMSDYSYDLLNADLIGGYGKEILRYLNHELDSLLVSKDTVSFKRRISNIAKEMGFDYTMGIPDSILVDSKDYADFLLDKIKLENRLISGGINYFGFYQGIKNVNNSSLRDKMITNFIMRYWVRINDHYDEILNDAAVTVKETYSLNKIKELERNTTGKKAFDFALEDVNGKIVNMHDFTGKVVFIDFWFTGCTACKHYYKECLKPVEQIYKDNPNIVFITVCIDKDKERWLNSLNSGEYASSGSVNLYTKGEGHKNDIIQYYNITTYPRPMLISRNGTIIKFSGNELRKKVVLIDELTKALKR